MSSTSDGKALVPASSGEMEHAPPAETTPPAERGKVARWAERLVRWLDDGVRIPGTRFGIGLDPIIGFFLPGAGDALTGAGSVSLLLLALKERVPTIAILRMLVNIGIDTLVGALPFAGDAFDAVWRSNRRNLDIIERYRDDPKAKPTVGDYALVGLGIVMAAASVVLPFVGLALLGGGIAAVFGD